MSYSKKVVLTAKDGYKHELHIFKAENPKAVIQIIHGMVEHQGCYEALAEVLVQNGFTVVSSDLRGHGKGAEELGFFSREKGYDALVYDQRLITRYIKKTFADLPLYIFSHSMGTIITRVLLQENSRNYDKVILSSFPNFQAGVYFGILLTEALKFFGCGKMRPKLVTAMSIGSFNKGIKNPQTEFDWLSYDEDAVREFMDDPYCGFTFTASAYSDLFHMVTKMHKPDKYRNVNKDMKMLLIWGEDDNCVGGAKGAADSLNVLKKAGFNAEMILFPHMRHVLINEKNKQAVYDKILSFYN